ncbi:MAG: ankyrin repeat domain-containing protein [Gammaproteobacteria bacterium]|nr:ankyrin repeat domain-containing protein [Gammaproteobacteria bacterium]
MLRSTSNDSSSSDSENEHKSEKEIPTKRTPNNISNKKYGIKTPGEAFKTLMEIGGMIHDINMYGDDPRLSIKLTEKLSLLENYISDDNALREIAYAINEQERTLFTELMIMLSHGYYGFQKENESQRERLLDYFIAYDATLPLRTDHAQRTALHYASNHGNVLAAEYLLRQSCAERLINLQDNHQKTALHYATQKIVAYEKFYNTALCLLAHGADPTLKDEHGKTARSIIKEKKNANDYLNFQLTLFAREMEIKFQLKKISHVDLYEAIQYNDLAAFEYYFAQQNQDPNCFNPTSEEHSTLLIEAFKANRIVIYYFLLKKSSDALTHGADPQGKTIVHHICQHKTSRKTVASLESLFAETKADVTIADKNGKTAFYAAIDERICDDELLTEILETFIKAGARKETLMLELYQSDKLSCQQRTFCLKILTESDPSIVNAQDSDGNTVMHYIAMKGLPGNHEAIKCLLDYNINLKLRNGESKTAFDVAAPGSDTAYYLQMAEENQALKMQLQQREIEKDIPTHKKSLTMF